MKCGDKSVSPMSLLTCSFPWKEYRVPHGSGLFMVAVSTRSPYIPDVLTLCNDMKFLCRRACAKVITRVKYRRALLGNKTVHTVIRSLHQDQKSEGNHHSIGKFTNQVRPELLHILTRTLLSTIESADISSSSMTTHVNKLV